MTHGFLRRMLHTALKRQWRRSRHAQPQPKSVVAWPEPASDAPSPLQTLEPRLLLSFDPTASEQLMFELVNQMRLDPSGELARLTTSLGTPARSNDADIDDALVFFGVNGSLLAQQFALLSAVPPLAWNESLINVADAHNQAMIASDVQSHEAPGEPPLSANGLRTRFNDQGYSAQSTIGENIFAFGESVLHGHAGFAIDWGGNSSTGGIQNPAGHRDTIMNGVFKEVGIKITPENSGTTAVGPLVITQDFGGIAGSQPYLLGVAFNDADGDAFYDIGEGLGGVNVLVEGISGTTGEFNVSSMSAGGWQVQVPTGTYRVTFSGGGLAQTIVRSSITVSTDNVKIDSLGPEIDVRGNNVSITDGDTSPWASDHTSFGNVQIDGATLTRTFTIENTGATTLNLTGNPRVQITGVNANEFSVISQPTATIEPGQSSSFQIRFDPAATGLRTATVQIINDDGNEALYDIAISGSGVAPEIDVRGNSSTIADGDTTPSTADFTDFRQVPVSSTALTSVTRTFSIRNTAATTLSLTGSPLVQITGAHAGDFSVTTQPVGTAVAAGDSLAFVITFNPSAAGLRTATVVIQSDDADEATYNFDIQGTGITTTTAGNGLQLATLLQGTGTGVSSGQGVRVFYTGYLVTGEQFDSNAGGNAFNFTLGTGQVIAGWDQGIAGMKIGEKRTLVIPASLAYGNNPPAGSGIPAGATLIFEVERVAADIAITSPQGSANIAIVSGDSTPSLTDHTDMGSVSLGGGSVPWTFRITATGALNLIGNPRVAIAGADAAAFTVNTQPPAAIVPGSGLTSATADFIITFNPQHTGQHQATVTILSDDPDEGTYTFSILGNGIANRISGAVEDTDFVITHALLNGAMRESGTSDYVVTSTSSGLLLRNGVPVIPGMTLSSGESFTWRPGANANRTIGAFSVKPFVGGVGVGEAQLIRVEVTPAEDAPTGAISNIALGSGGEAADQTLNLASLFSDADIAGTIVRIATSLGDIDVHLFDNATPATVANFMNYANDGDWVNTIIHRVIAGFIVQGGGFKPQLPASHILTDPAITNEFGVSNQRGTIVMAKVSNQINSATSEWFFNLGDNSAKLDNQNAGFTVFGEVIGNGMTVVDDIAALPLFTSGSTLTSFPLSNYVNGAVQDAHWVKINSVTTLSSLTFAIVSNSNPALVAPTLTGALLDLDFASAAVGSSDITIRATDRTGRSLDVTFTISVAGISVSAIDNQAAEPASGQPANTGQFRITRAGLTDDALTVNFTLTGSAVHGTDYQTIPLEAVIPAGQSFVDVTITPLADALSEGLESVMLSISTHSSYTITGSGNATSTITDDTAIVLVTAVDALAAETVTGQPADGGVIRFSRTGSLGQPLTVQYTIAGQASNGIDYQLIPQSIIIPAGASTFNLGITALNDSLSEAAENVTVALATSDSYFIDNNSSVATVTIIDDDPTLVQIATITGNLSENTPDTSGIVRISRTGNTDADLLVKFTRNGKAKFGSTGDYTLSIGQTDLTTTSITIPAGQAFVEININVINDTLPDAGETVILKLAKGTGYAIPALPADQIVELAIADNEPDLTIASTGFSGADDEAGESDQGQASNTSLFRITRTGQTTLPLEIKYTLLGTAKGKGADYIIQVSGQTITARTITLPADADHVDVLVIPTNDAIVENTETVILKLVADKKKYTLPVDKLQQLATVTIADNEPTVSVTALDATADEPGGTGNTGTFRISRTGSTGGAIDVAFKIAGTARAGSDYVKLGTKVTIPAGASFVDLDIEPLMDAAIELSETVLLTLGKSKAYYLAANALASTITITDSTALSGADLVALSLTVPAKTFSLSAITSDLKVAASIKNQGNLATIASAQVRVLLSKDRTPDAGDIQLGFLNVGALAAGKASTVSGNFNITSLGLTSTAIGSYFLLLVIDDANSVNESIETNNLIASQLANISVIA